VLAGHLRFGFVRALASTGGDIELLHPRKRLYAGGSHSVRGYDETQLGPRILTIPPGDLLNAGCDTTEALLRSSCDPNVGIQNKQFTPRPVGGTSLLEGSVEMRYPFARKMEWAAFIDFGIVGGSRLQNLQSIREIVKGSKAITPGVGFRYKSPVGPIRIDLGYNPQRTQDLTVVTTATDATGREVLVPLQDTRRYTNGGRARGFWALFNQLVLHLSIGQAY
jgi:outer membrane protein assembly factor BamA